jgi:hypothetical protein
MGPVPPDDSSPRSLFFADFRLSQPRFSAIAGIDAQMEANRLRTQSTSMRSDTSGSCSCRGTNDSHRVRGLPLRRHSGRVYSETILPIGVNGVLPSHYEYPAAATIVCPKCGHSRSVPLAVNTNISLEYASVCGARLKSGLRCDAMLILEVAAHLAPAPQGG